MSNFSLGPIVLNLYNFTIPESNLPVDYTAPCVFTNIAQLIVFLTPLRADVYDGTLFVSHISQMIDTADNFNPVEKSQNVIACVNNT